MGRRRKVHSVDVKNTVTIRRKIGVTGTFPPYVILGQRHLEKEAAAPPNATNVTFTVPLDLLRLALPEEHVEQIESVEFMYHRSHNG